MKAILCAMLMLAACADQQPILKPVEVDIPISVPCKTAPVIAPDFALAKATVQQSLFDKLKAAIVELDQRKAYEARLNAEVDACG